MMLVDNPTHITDSEELNGIAYICRTHTGIFLSYGAEWKCRSMLEAPLRNLVWRNITSHVSIIKKSYTGKEKNIL